LHKEGLTALTTNLQSHLNDNQDKTNLHVIPDWACSGIFRSVRKS